MFNSIQLFGLVLLGGLAAGEVSRRFFALPRTTGYVVFGLFLGQSGLQWISLEHIESAELFIDLALGLILFELGYSVPPVSAAERKSRLWAGLSVSLVTGGAVFVVLLAWGFSLYSALFAASLCLATSPAITIATTSDVGARGDKTGLLFTLVAVTGCVAFVAVAWSNSVLFDYHGAQNLSAATVASQKVFVSMLLGVACAGLVLVGAERLGKHPEHQHLLILGTIVLGVGTSIALEISALLPMLIFGYITRVLDREKHVAAIRIASDARIFLVITFVLAGAALDVAVLAKYWPQALTLALARFAGQFVAVYLHRHRLGLSAGDSVNLAIGLQPMSSVALVLLFDIQELNSSLDPALAGTLLATILLMQLLGPFATQVSIKGFGEATRLNKATGTGDGAAVR